MSIEEPSMPTPYVCYSNGIEISVWPKFDEASSSLDMCLFTYSYTIKIKNISPHAVKLLARKWIIEDAFNNVEEVSGDGVVGVTPEIRSGEAFIYTSFCPLKTPSGRMSGSYKMQGLGGETFYVDIKPFEFKNPLLMN